MATVMNAVAQTLAILLLIEEGVDQLDILDQIAAFIANNLVHVIEAEVLLYTSPSYFTFTIHAFGQEEGHVLVAGGEFAQGVEHGHLLPDFHAVHAALELAQEALVRQPEQADVGNLEQTHRQPVQSKPYGPAAVLLSMIQQENNDGPIRVGIHLGLDCATAEELWVISTIEACLHPLAIAEHLHLQRWIGEREVGVDPAVLELRLQYCITFTLPSR